MTTPAQPAGDNAQPGASLAAGIPTSANPTRRPWRPPHPSPAAMFSATPHRPMETHPRRRPPEPAKRSSRQPSPRLESTRCPARPPGNGTHPRGGTGDHHPAHDWPRPPARRCRQPTETPPTQPSARPPLAPPRGTGDHHPAHNSPTPPAQRCHRPNLYSPHAETPVTTTPSTTGREVLRGTITSRPKPAHPTRRHR